MVNSHLIDAIPEHRVALAAASLPVGKERGVKAFPGVIQHTAAQVIKHLERKELGHFQKFSVPDDFVGLEAMILPWSDLRILGHRAQNTRLCFP